MQITVNLALDIDPDVWASERGWAARDGVNADVKRYVFDRIAGSELHVDSEAIQAVRIINDTTITLSESEQCLLLANENNDHPGWSTIARKIQQARE